MLDDLKHQDIKPSTLVKTEKDGEWVPIKDDGDLNFLVKVKSNYRITDHNEGVHSVRKKSKPIIVILALVFLLIMGMALFIYLGLQPQM